MASPVKRSMFGVLARTVKILFLSTKYVEKALLRGADV
jgi:hypothetical protein